jgi:hypothetical protein
LYFMIYLYFCFFLVFSKKNRNLEQSWQKLANKQVSDKTQGICLTWCNHDFSCYLSWLVYRYELMSHSLTRYHPTQIYTINH